MRLLDVQQMLYAYLKNKSVFLILLQISAVLLMVYPIYLLLTRISFLDGFISIIRCISPIFYCAYFLGLILCFAKNEMLLISAAFAIRALIVIIDIFMYSFGISSVINIAIYIALAGFTFLYSRIAAEN